MTASTVTYGDLASSDLEPQPRRGCRHSDAGLEPYGFYRSDADYQVTYGDREVTSGHLKPIPTVTYGDLRGD